MAASPASTTREPGRWAPVWLVIVAVPTAYLLFLLVAGGIAELQAGVGASSIAVTIVLLVVAPFITWLIAFVFTFGSFPRRSCAALYATALTLPVSFTALAALWAMRTPFLF